jgi:hypothetical protein
MSDDDLIGYLFDLLDPTERAAVAARAAADPATAARLEHLRAAAAPLLGVLEAEREEPPEPAAGLAVRTVARLAEHLVGREPREPEPVEADAGLAARLRAAGADSPAGRDFGSVTRPLSPRALLAALSAADGPDHRTGPRLRVDLLVAACIAFVGFGLVLSGVAKARYQSQVMACQNGLRTLSAGLTGYADADPQGRYPQVGTPEYPTADTFGASLIERGFLPVDYKPGCPAAAECPAYAYTLGFRGPDEQVVGLRRPGGTSDPADEGGLMPIAADLPCATVAPAGGFVSPHAACMNVLFVGGNVRLTSSPNVGPHGDDIYRNYYGQVAAGANNADAVLGGIGAKP